MGHFLRLMNMIIRYPGKILFFMIFLVSLNIASILYILGF